MTRPTAGPRRNLVQTQMTLFWMYGGRGVGLLWTVALLSQLGVADYGRYGLAFALGAVVGPPLDNAFTVRAVRESERRYLSERTCRFLLGVVLVVLGAALSPLGFVVWFGLVYAGAEVAFGGYKSRFLRASQPQHVWRLDTTRQLVSVALAGTYLLLADDPDLARAGILYLLPYAVIIVLAGVQTVGHRPVLPGTPRQMATLGGEMFGTTLYLQADVLLLGALTNATVVGYYALTVTVAAAVIAVGHAFGATYHEALRESGGTLESGPPLRSTLAIGAVAFVPVLLIGIGLVVFDAPDELAVAMLIMSVFCMVRTVILVFQVVLYAQHRDTLRLVTAFGIVPVKYLALVALSPAGAIGAAIATVGADAIVLLVFATVLYARPFTPTPTEARVDP